ncbi:TIGR01777 family oxidoreductase [Cytophagales bacterium LB-30]|uniref:TIGR01777 family oxidoreductase n=2 Tax=Shiella aurantiaca TaxID=3058365 RepID=A0ABT8F671_9BACT|nr:TIGR01777 family oxidoreductase [Shiella aurantiaca]
MEKILISGGSGLVGQALTQHLTQQGHEVAWLSRSQQKGQKTFLWDVKNQEIAPEALAWASHIIHLAGAGVADKRWTPAYKKEILDSRVQATRLLVKGLKQYPNAVKKVVSASAMGIYGTFHQEEWVEEESPAGKDFLAKVTQEWENEVQQLQSLGIPEVRMRISIVLAKEGGALPTLMLPVRFGLASAIGKGSQYMSWIHIKDLCRLFSWALLESDIQGALNAASPQPETNADFMKTLAKVMRKPFFLPSVPSWVLHLAMGEKAIIATSGVRLSVNRLTSKGVTFVHPDLATALESLLKE